MAKVNENQSSLKSDYFKQITKQWEQIRNEIKRGNTVTITLFDSDKSISLVASKDEVNLVPAKNTIQSHADVYFKGQINQLTNFAFDLDEAENHIYAIDINEQLEMTTLDREKEISLFAAALNPNDLMPMVTFNGTDWIVEKDCTYESNQGFQLTAKMGFRTDLASIPRILWWGVAPFELSLIAPIMHDLVYRSMGIVSLPNGEVVPLDKTFTRKEADDLFLELMTRLNISYWERNIAYLAVRSFGESAWKKSL